jgi:alkyldihydroxyacetonephosphate synthase
MNRRRKFWGWGWEDERADPQKLRALEAAAQAWLGMGEFEVVEPPRLEQLALRPPRVKPPQTLAALTSDDPLDRASHCYGKSYRDLPRRFSAN